jgi:hypothetical protein
MKHKLIYFGIVTMFSTSLLLASERVEFNYLSEVIAGDIERSTPISKKTLSHFVSLAGDLSLKDDGAKDIKALKEEILKTNANNADYINRLFDDLNKIEGVDKDKAIAIALNNILFHLSNRMEISF